jgi:N-acetylglucosamine malate deacetylase 1
MGEGAKLVSEACFLSGLMKIETEFEGETQEAWRPKMFIITSSGKTWSPI